MQPTAKNILELDRKYCTDKRTLYKVQTLNQECTQIPTEYLAHNSLQDAQDKQHYTAINRQAPTIATFHSRPHGPVSRELIKFKASSRPQKPASKYWMKELTRFTPTRSHLAALKGPYCCKNHGSQDSDISHNLTHIQPQAPLLFNDMKMWSQLNQASYDRSQAKSWYILAI